MKNTVKFVAVCVATPVVALGVAAPTAWAEVQPHGAHGGGLPEPPRIEPHGGIDPHEPPRGGHHGPEPEDLAGPPVLQFGPALLGSVAEPHQH
jgi:hypothetical protein